MACEKGRGRTTLEATRYFQDWGPWGWVWAGGHYAFLLGLILVPLVLSGEAPAALVLAAVPGAVLMRGALGAVEGRGTLETNI